MGELLIVFFDSLILHKEKRRLRIINLVREGLDNERVTIENPSLFSIDIANWVLYDQARNKFRFTESVVIKGKNFFTRKKKTLTIWTKRGNRDQDNFFLGREKEIWNNDKDTAYLQDPSGRIIDTYSYGQ